MSNDDNSLTAGMVDLALTGLPKDQGEPDKMVIDEGSVPKPLVAGLPSDQNDPDKMVIDEGSVRPDDDLGMAAWPYITLTPSTSEGLPVTMFFLSKRFIEPGQILELPKTTSGKPLSALVGQGSKTAPSLGPSGTLSHRPTPRPVPNPGTSALGTAPFGGAMKGSSGPGNLPAAGSGTRNNYPPTLPRPPAFHHGQSSPAGRQAQPRTMLSFLPLRTKETPTMALSRECQKRGFNPEWFSKTTNEGRICVDVGLGGTLVKGLSSHANSQEAKYATSKLALNVVQGMPYSGNIGSRSQPAIKNEPGIKQEPRVKQEARSPRVPTFHTAQRAEARRPMDVWGRTFGNMAVQRPTGPTGPSDSALFAAQATRQLGISLPNSDPELTRAFLEGVAVGSRLTGSPFDLPLRGRRTSRSRSPVRSGRGPVDHYRTRSPRRKLRLEVDTTLRLHTPPRYGDFLGRPHSDYYRPDGQVTNRPTTRNPDLESEIWGHDGYYEQQSYFKREQS